MASMQEPLLVSMLGPQHCVDLGKRLAFSLKVLQVYTVSQVLQEPWDVFKVSVLSAYAGPR